MAISWFLGPVSVFLQWVDVGHHNRENRDGFRVDCDVPSTFLMLPPPTFRFAVDQKDMIVE